jgi:hypothetical protein
MRYFFTLLSIFFFLSGCTERKNDIVFKSFEYEVDNVLVSSEETNYNIEKTGDDFKVKYCKGSGCVSYLIKDKISLYVSEKGDTFDLVFDKKIEYKINDRIYAIKMFVMDRNAIDSETQHYWSPEFGIILIRSTTWDGLKILTKSDKDNGDVLSTLTTILLKDQLLTNPVDKDSLVMDSLVNKMIEEELK